MLKMTTSTNFIRIWKYHLAKMYCNQDRVIAICGPEGWGKSRTLFLHSLDVWYRVCRDMEVPKGRYGVSILGFRNAFLAGKPYDFTGLDECGDIMNKQDFRDKFNSSMYKTYTVIREDKQLTVLVMPHFFDFAPGFRKRRIAGLFQVVKLVPHKCKDCLMDHGQKECPYCGSTSVRKGHIVWRYFNRKNLDIIIFRNRFREKPSMNVGAEYIEGRMQEYEGPLLQEYTKLKRQKVKEKKEQFARDMEELDQEEQQRKCPHCGSRDFRYLEGDKLYKCRSCPMRWKPSRTELDRKSVV